MSQHAPSWWNDIYCTCCTQVSWGDFFFLANVTFLALLLTHYWVFCTNSNSFSILICGQTIKHLLSAFLHSYQIKCLNITLQQKRNKQTLQEKRDMENFCNRFHGDSEPFFLWRHVFEQETHRTSFSAF